MKISFKNLTILIAIPLVLLFGCGPKIIYKPPFEKETLGQLEKTFSFFVLADPRNKGETWRNALLKISSIKNHPESLLSPVDLLLIPGDMDPLNERYDDFQMVFPSNSNRPLFLPVIGNHEFDDGATHYRYARDVVIPSIPGIVRRHSTSCDYYLDHKNIRIIVIDGYSELGKNGVINDKGRNWVKRIIEKTPLSIGHIFVSFHEPAFPRHRHLKDSFNEIPELRNAFWQMLLDEDDRVRAVFVGHTHHYSRLRVADPAGIPANDTTKFPDEDGGIYQIDVGAAGHGKKNTIVEVKIKGKNIFFRTLNANVGENMVFKTIDEWSIISPKSTHVRINHRK